MVQVNPDIPSLSASARKQMCSHSTLLRRAFPEVSCTSCRESHRMLGFVPVPKFS
jgi:hypothetical protein